MKVIVLGSGVIGTTTSYYLSALDHEVVVLDRQPEAALECSHANAGQVSPGYSAPWAAPGIPLKALKWLLQEHSPLVIRPSLDPRLWSWAVAMLRNCTSRAYAINKERMLRLASYSREQFQILRETTGIAYDERTRGTLQLFRTQKQVDSAARDIAVLERCEIPYQLLDREGCVQAEPALALVREKVAGGLRLPNDETGDCFKFTQSMVNLAESGNVEFRFGVNITGLSTAGDNLTGVETDQGTIVGDAYVVAMGSYSPLFLKPIGIRIPVYPVKGYSITVPIAVESGAPVSTIMDETHKVAITRLGDRIRVAGTAELSGYDNTLRESRRKTVDHVITDLFPRGGNVSEAEFWCGLRPMTPDGTPIVGPTRFRNLFLNTGHGTLGWTMCCGSGRLLADIISGREPEISSDGLTIERYLAG